MLLLLGFNYKIHSREIALAQNVSLKKMFVRAPYNDCGSV